MVEEDKLFISDALDQVINAQAELLLLWKWFQDLWLRSRQSQYVDFVILVTFDSFYWKIAFVSLCS